MRGARVRPRRWSGGLCRLGSRNVPPRKSTETASRERAGAYRRELERDIEDRVYKQGSCWAEAMNDYVEKRGNRQASFLKPILAQFGAMQLKDITPVVVSLYV